MGLFCDVEKFICVVVVLMLLTLYAVDRDDLLQGTSPFVVLAVLKKHKPAAASCCLSTACGRLFVWDLIEEGSLCGESDFKQERRTTFNMPFFTPSGVVAGARMANRR